MAGERLTSSRTRKNLPVACAALVLGMIVGMGGKEFVYDPWQQSRCQAENPAMMYTLSEVDVAALRQDGLNMFRGINPLHARLSETALGAVLDATATGSSDKQLQVEVPYAPDASSSPLSRDVVADAALVSGLIADWTSNTQLRVLAPTGIPSDMAYPSLPMLISVETTC